MFKSFIVIISVVSIFFMGCASPGPMQQAWGPVNTPVFSPIVIDTVKDGSVKVHFKEWTTMYENKNLQAWGVFFITDHGAYMVRWDTDSYQYSLIYRIAINQIESLHDDIVVRNIWYDSNLIVIKDISGHEVGFALNGKNAVRSILSEIRNKGCKP